MRVLVAALVAVFLFANIHVVRASTPPASLKPDILEIIKITDEINDDTATTIETQVQKINDSKLVKAVLLELDTPGGGVQASSNIYESLSKLKVPVVVWCDSMCASGGMYISMAPTVKFIAIRQQTIAGSIGVIMHNTNYSRLLDWARIDNRNFKSGLYKDTGDPSRAMNDDDVKYLQSIVDEFAGEFYGLVEKARGSKITDWTAVKSARIFIGENAVKIGLVDAVMTEDEAKQKAKDLSGSKAIFTRDEIKAVTDSPDASNYEAPHLNVNSFFNDAKWAIGKAREIANGSAVRFEYLCPLSF